MSPIPNGDCGQCLCQCLMLLRLRLSLRLVVLSCQFDLSCEYLLFFAVLIVSPLYLSC